MPPKQKPEQKPEQPPESAKANPRPDPFRTLNSTYGTKASIPRDKVTKIFKFWEDRITNTLKNVENLRKALGLTLEDGWSSGKVEYRLLALLKSKGYVSTHVRIQSF
jgi:hypothetical protein